MLRQDLQPSWNDVMMQVTRDYRRSSFLSSGVLPPVGECKHFNYSFTAVEYDHYLFSVLLEAYIDFVLQAEGFPLITT